MAAGEGHLVTRSVVANADLSSKQFYFVDLNTSDKAVVVSTAGTDYYGVLQNDPESGQMATVAVSGLTKVIAGAALALGDEVSVDANGKAVPATGGMSAGVCRRAAASGNVAIIELYKTPRVVQPLFLGSVSNTTATGAITLTNADPTFQRIDPGGANRNVTLPAEETSIGRAFLFTNLADAAENLVIKDDAANTIVTLNQNEAAFVVCDGTAWRHCGVITIAQT